MQDFGEISINVENHIKVEVGSATKGKSEYLPNEDNSFFNGNAAGVFDGVGGRSGGEKASRIASDYLKQVFYSEQVPDSCPAEELEDFIRQKLHGANYLVYTAKDDGEPSGATTTTLALVRTSEKGTPYVLFANVGDSRGYILRRGYLFQITVDDNDLRKAYGNGQDAMRAQDRLNRAGKFEELNEEERVFFHYRNKISQALGESQIEPSFYTSVLEEGDQIILMSDGVSDNLTTAEMEAALGSGQSPQEMAEHLVESAHKRSMEGRKVSFRSKPDDITALVLSPKIANSTNRNIAKKEVERVDKESSSEKDDAIPSYLRRGDLVRVRYKGTITRGVIKSYIAGGNNFIVSCPGKLFGLKVDRKLVEEINPPEVGQVLRGRDSREFISYLKNFHGVESSSGKFISGTELSERVKAVMEGRGDLTLIPRAGGLRQKVAELLRAGS